MIWYCPIKNRVISLVFEQNALCIRSKLTQFGPITHPWTVKNNFRLQIIFAISVPTNQSQEHGKSPLRNNIAIYIAYLLLS